MKRVIKFELGTIDSINERKYVFYNGYKDFIIYEEITPSGYRKAQSWLITNGNIAIVCSPFMNICKEELLDMIDSYNETKKFGIKAINKINTNNMEVYIAHQNGKEMI